MHLMQLNLEKNIFLFTIKWRYMLPFNFLFHILSQLVHFYPCLIKAN